MNIIKATDQYEQWLSNQLIESNLALDTKALQSKHDEMSEKSFPFLRSTFYQWVYRWLNGEKSSWQQAPELLAVGDLHVENFGTWRDYEGRLIWGINDFDEAFRLPYTNDLVRLATSIYLAMIKQQELRPRFRNVCRQLLAGYQVTLEGGRENASPFVLLEGHLWLRKIADDQLSNPEKFWRKLDEHPSVALRDGATDVNPNGVPSDCRMAIERRLPKGFKADEWKRRKAGLGSLGRPRFVGLGYWQGGRLAREAKALVPSAAFWAKGEAHTESFVTKIIDDAVRCPDPFFAVDGRWVVRRLAPDCDKLELARVPKRWEADFLFALGRETANIHLGSSEAIPLVIAHLNDQPEDWLEEAAIESAQQVIADWEIWKNHHPIRKKE